METAEDAEDCNTQGCRGTLISCTAADLLVVLLNTSKSFTSL